MRSPLCNRIQPAKVLAPILFMLTLSAMAGEVAAEQSNCIPPGTTLTAGSQICLPVISTSYYFSSCGYLSAGDPVRWQIFWGATAADAASKDDKILQVKATSSIINYDYINNATLFPGYFMACVANGSTVTATIGYWCEQDYQCRGY
jgi:hypothetical protein